VSKRRGKSSVGTLVIEVGGVRVKATNTRTDRRSVEKVLNATASVVVAMMASESLSAKEDEDDQPPFGFAPVTASTDIADVHHDPRFDYVWEEGDE